MRILRNFIMIAIFISGVVLVKGTAQAQNGDQEQFANGIVVEGPFLRFYHSAPDPWLLFGYPISGEMVMGNKRVQFFDRARFEMTIGDKEQKVTLANLGWSEFNETYHSLTAIGNPGGACRQFPASGRFVCYSFLQFYDENDGPTYFGEPVSDLIRLNDQLVQYFEFARLEWQPNSDNPLHIGLTNVGRISLEKITGVSVLPLPPTGIPGRPLEPADFTVKAFVEQALVAPGAGNTVYVVVQTPLLKPIAGASVHVVANLKDGKQSFPGATTDVDGIARISIPGLKVDPKQIVQIEVSVDLVGGKSHSATTWYRVWY